MLNPGLPEGQAALGRLLLEAGRIEEGMRRIEAAISLDPGVPLGCGTLAPVNALLDRWDAAKAIAAQQRETEGETGYWMTCARMVLWTYQKDMAEAFLSELSLSSEYETARAMIEVVARAELSDEAAMCLAIGRSPEGGIRRRLLYLQIEAAVMSILGDVERSIGALQRAAAVGLTDLFWLERCRVLDRVRADPRFIPVHAVVSRRAREILEAYDAS
jgi:tetratricopeptide (TPR) repeat protein